MEETHNHETEEPTKMSSDAVERIENLLVTLDWAQEPEKRGVALRCKEVIPFIPEYLQDTAYEAVGSNVLYLGPGEVGFGDLARPFHVNLAVSSPVDRYAFVISELRQTDARRQRGKVSQVFNEMAEMRVNLVTPHGSVAYQTPWECFGRNAPGFKWVPCSKKIAKHTAETLDDCRRSLDLGPSVQFTSETMWEVSLKRDESPRVLFATDPQGALEAYKLRDVPQGKRRRDALLHWVGAHWRRNRLDPDVEHEVREYLRGARTFMWNGFEVSLRASLAEETRNAEGEPSGNRRPRRKKPLKKRRKK